MLHVGYWACSPSGLAELALIPESLGGTMPESDEDEGRQKIWHGLIQLYV